MKWGEMKKPRDLCLSRKKRILINNENFTVLYHKFSLMKFVFEEENYLYNKSGQTINLPER